MLRREPLHRRASNRHALVCAAALAGATLAADGFGASLGEKARESGCVSKPAIVVGSTYKCVTQGGAFSYFNVPNGGGGPVVEPGRSASSSPGSFPRIDSATQKSRDNLRRNVLNDELASEEKLLAEARGAYGNGAPPALADEQKDAEKYRQRIARLRESVQLHERNVEALKKELASIR
jgi:hypothetical protein